MRKRRANERCSANSNVHTTNLTTRAQMTTGFNVRDPVTTNIVHYQSDGVYNRRNKGRNKCDRIAPTEDGINCYYRESKRRPRLKRLVVRVKSLLNQVYEPHCCIILFSPKQFSVRRRNTYTASRKLQSTRSTFIFVHYPIR